MHLTNSFHTLLGARYDVQVPVQGASVYVPGRVDDQFVSSILDECLLWTRDSIAWLTRFTQRDQECVIPLSLKEAIGDSAWKLGLQQKVWNLTIPLNADDSLGNPFCFLRHCRLRGLQAFVVGGDEDGVWQFRLTPPVKTSALQFKFPNGEEDAKPKEFRQQGANAVRLGRVMHRQATREPDLVGASTLRNLSPFGEWKIELLGGGKQSIEQRLEDLQLDLFVAYRPKLEVGDALETLF